MPGRAGEQDDAAATGGEIAETPRSSPSSRSRPTTGVVVARGSRSFARRRCDCADGLLSALDGDLDRPAEVEAVLEPARGDLADEDRPGLGRGLEARRDVRRVAERDGLRIGAADEPDRCGPAVHADPHGEPRDSPGRLDVSRVAADDLEDAKRRAGGALGVVLVRGRNAEVRADPVALVRLHRAAVLVDGAAHHRHALADEHLRLVGLEPLAERRRADDVGEEHGDRAPLVLDLPRSRRRGRRGRRPRFWPAGHRGRCERRDRSERLVLAEDRLLESPQLGVRLEAELLVEELPEGSVRLERVGMAARAVESDHQMRAESLVERVEPDERLQLADGLGLAADGEHRLEPRLERLEPQALEPGDLGLCEGLGCQVGERGPAPEREGPCEGRFGFGERLRAERGLTFGQEPLELVHVELAGRDAEEVAGRFRDERAVVSSPRSLRSFET